MTEGTTTMPAARGARRLAPDEVALPGFDLPAPHPGGAFALSSHRRAREALEFGLSIREPDFNIFVVGEDRSGRMTATLRFVDAMLAERPRANDWIYVNNLRRMHRPRPYRLPGGVGRKLRDRMQALLHDARAAIAGSLASEGFRGLVEGETARLRDEAAHRFAIVEAEAKQLGVSLVQTNEGAIAIGAPQPAPGAAEAPPLPSPQAMQTVHDRLQRFGEWGAQARRELTQRLEGLVREIIDQSVGALADAVVAEFKDLGGIGRWLTEVRVDMVDRLTAIYSEAREISAEAFAELERRYAVNLLVDHAEEPHPPVIVEPNPTYENLFGQFEYAAGPGVAQSDMNMIRGGALHRANGGVLVLRAEAIAANPAVWAFLKGALRDREIRIEEQRRPGDPPRSGALRPKAVPLDVKVILVGAPRWYQAFFTLDADFQTYFKVKADIDGDMATTPENLAAYSGLLEELALQHGRSGCAPAAKARLLGIAARWAGRRDRLTARFELIEDLIAEACHLQNAPDGLVPEDAIDAALANRRRRRSRTEDRAHEAIAAGTIIISTRGAALGQVNALVVQDVGDHVFGMPARVTARCSVGRRGIVNVERDVNLGGPIQQKASLIIQGWLTGRFARRFPLSFTCSVTFEQTYGGVEGDSASMAELIAILSDLTRIPVRQDVAITGSVNQLGESQAVGGVHEKIEGFYRACRDSGGLTGTQGVIVPEANIRNVVLREEISDAVRDGRFHVWSVANVDAAIELLLGRPVGAADGRGDYPPDTVYGRVHAELEAFDRLLAARDPVRSL